MSRARTGSLEMRKGVWHARITVDLAEGGSKREWYSLGTADRKMAACKLKSLLAEVYGSPDEPRRRVYAERFADLAYRYLVTREGLQMYRDEKSMIDAHLVPKLGKMRASDVSAADIRTILEATSDKRATKLRVLIGRIFGLAVREGSVGASPVEGLRSSPRINIKQRQMAGYLYAIEFSTRRVKIGMSANPSERIAQHAADAAKHGVAVGRQWISDVHAHFRESERAAKARCASVAMPYAGSEYFEIAFDVAVGLLLDAIEETNPGAIARAA